MPGLLGFFKQNCPAESARESLSRMASALETDDRFHATVHHEAGIGIGAVALKSRGTATDLAWNEDRTICAVLDGELYDVPALLPLIAGERGGPDGRNQAALVLRLYERLGADFAVKLNGAFAIAIWDRKAHRLLVVNDRLGLVPVYYTRVNGDLLFASGVRALLADPRVNRTADLVAINQFVVHDHVLDDRTLVESVKLLPQASILTVADGDVAIRPFWTLRYPDVYEPQPEIAYVEQLMDHLRVATSRQQPHDKPGCVLLSGGLDSRMLLGLLSGFAGNLQTLTFGIPGCDDAQVAREVAAAVGTRHAFIELKPDWLLRLADEAVRSTDGLANVVNLHTFAPLDAQGRDDQILYKGMMGDALLGFALKRQMWGDYTADNRHRVHLGVHTEQGVVNYDRGEQAKLLTDTFQSRVGDAVSQSYREGMERSGSSQLANQRLYFDLTQRVPRMTLKGVEIARRRGIIRLPFCDNDLIDFALTVPPGFLFERHLPKAVLVKHFPRLARIPIAGSGRPLALCARDIAVQAKNLMSWHLRHAGLGWLAARERRPYKDYDRWFRTLLRPWVEHTLISPRALERGYFRPDYVRQLVADHMSGANHGVRIGALLTLELWHRQCVD